MAVGRLIPMVYENTIFWTIAAFLSINIKQFTFIIKIIVDNFIIYVTI